MFNVKFPYKHQYIIFQAIVVEWIAISFKDIGKFIILIIPSTNSLKWLGDGEDTNTLT